MQVFVIMNDTDDGRGTMYTTVDSIWANLQEAEKHKTYLESISRWNSYYIDEFNLQGDF